MRIHGGPYSAQISRWGAGKSLSAKAPPATAIRPGLASASHQTVEPQAGQKRKNSGFPDAPVRSKTVASPQVPMTLSSEKKAVTPNAEPVRRWHAWHAQLETYSGSPSSRMVSFPQLQLASRTAMAFPPLQA
jgi:hypothetical protein